MYEMFYRDILDFFVFVRSFSMSRLLRFCREVDDLLDEVL